MYVDMFSTLGTAKKNISSPPYDDLLETLKSGMLDPKNSGEKL